MMTTRQPNAWSVCGASAAAVSAVAAIAGGVVDYRAPATPGAGDSGRDRDFGDHGDARIVCDRFEKLHSNGER